MDDMKDITDNSFVNSLLAAGFPKKWAKLLPEVFISDSPDGWDIEKIKNKLYEYQSAIDITEGEMDANVELATYKEKVKELTSPYKETIQVHRAMIKYLLFVGYSRGK
jgi:hypothetical protein